MPQKWHFSLWQFCHFTNRHSLFPTTSLRNSPHNCQGSHIPSQPHHPQHTSFFAPLKLLNGDHREISVFPFQTTGITQINSLCWNVLLPHKSLSRRTRCQIIGCADWGRCWPEATEQVRTASSIKTSSLNRQPVVGVGTPPFTLRPYVGYTQCVHCMYIHQTRQLYRSMWVHNHLQTHPVRQCL